MFLTNANNSQKNKSRVLLSKIYFSNLGPWYVCKYIHILWRLPTRYLLKTIISSFTHSRLSSHLMLHFVWFAAGADAEPLLLSWEKREKGLFINDVMQFFVFLTPPWYALYLRKLIYFVMISWSPFPLKTWRLLWIPPKRDDDNIIIKVALKVQPQTSLYGREFAFFSEELVIF